MLGEETGVEEQFEVIMAENFPKLTIDSKPQIRKLRRHQQEKYQSLSTAKTKQKTNPYLVISYSNCRKTKTKRESFKKPENLGREERKPFT